MKECINNLLVAGISHKTAPVEIREKISVPPEKTSEFLDLLLEDEGIEEAILLSTCNRTELYAVAKYSSHGSVQDWIANLIPSAGNVAPYRYVHSGEEAARHLFRVCAGLDSMAVGESQIQGQVKKAYLDAHSASSVGPYLHQLFQFALNTAKSVRGDSGLDAVHSLAYAAIKEARQRLGTLTNTNTVVVGAGETAELAAFHLRKQGCTKLHFVNRSIGGAERLARQFQASAYSLDSLKHLLQEADLVFSATGSQSPIIGTKELSLRTTSKKLLLVDLGMPRDIDANVANLASCSIVCLDDFRKIIADSEEMKFIAIRDAEAAIDQAIHTWHQISRIRTVVPTICAMRAEAAKARRRTLSEARRIEKTKGKSAALEYLANTLTNRLMHAPTVRLRAAAASEDTTLIDAARELFALDADDQDEKGQDNRAA